MDKVAGIILLVNSIEISVAFYKKLGFLVTEERPDIATILKLGEFWIELLNKTKVVSEEYKKDVVVSEKGAGTYLQIQVKDIDNFHTTIVNNGVLSASEPGDYPWNQREFIVVDPNGYKIAFFSKI